MVLYFFKLHFLIAEYYITNIGFFNNWFVGRELIWGRKMSALRRPLRLCECRASLGIQRKQVRNFEKKRSFFRLLTLWNIIKLGTIYSTRLIFKFIFFKKFCVSTIIGLLSTMFLICGTSFIVTVKDSARCWHIKPLCSRAIFLFFSFT